MAEENIIIKRQIRSRIRSESRSITHCRNQQIRIQTQDKQQGLGPLWGGGGILIILRCNNLLFKYRQSG